MDTAWNQVAGQYGFICNGCADNCCRTLFFHHTHLEKDYLLEGFSTIAPDIRDRVLEKAAQYCDRLLLHASLHKSLDMMCPLNQDNQCLIYEYRPMICRLHGLPHELFLHGSSIQKHPGCAAGTPFFNRHGYIPFDRTPFYARMADAESAYRKAIHQKDRVKYTIAQMLTMEPPGH